MSSLVTRRFGSDAGSSIKEYVYGLKFIIRIHTYRIVILGIHVQYIHIVWNCVPSYKLHNIKNNESNSFFLNFEENKS